MRAGREKVLDMRGTSPSSRMFMKLCLRFLPVTHTGNMAIFDPAVFTALHYH